MKHGSLFSGIGGFDLASEWMGWENVFHCEIGEFPRKVLHHYWPNAISYEDIKQTDFTIHRGKIDILTGGFPCQPYSQAGKRLGKEDERHLWPEMLRAIQEIQPAWVVGENVRGLVNWNGGLVFDEVQADLESEGYEIQPFILPACAVNAPHRRDRVWFVAYSDSNGQHERNCGNEINTSERRFNAQCNPESSNGNGNATNSDNKGLERGSIKRSTEESRKERKEQLARYIRTGWQDFPTQPPICGGDDGLPSELDGITFSKWRSESIKGYGNAVVPQVVYQIFQAIKQYNTDHDTASAAHPDAIG